MVARRAAVFRGDPDSLGAGRIPFHLLLLPRRLLQGVLGRSAIVRGWRTAPALPRRECVSAHRPEHPSLFSLPRARLPDRARLRRLESVLVHRRRDRPPVVRHRCRHPGPGDQRRLSCELYLRLPLAAPSGRRPPRPIRRTPRPDRALRCRVQLQLQPHAVGLGEPLLGGARRLVRPPLLDGPAHRLEAALSYETHEHDVLVVGAGGAGLRAAIEASAAGVAVGLLCKSLLGKAHTVMAEGGIAAALANTDDREDRKSTRLNSSHLVISYAVFCLKKKKTSRYEAAGSTRRGSHPAY